MLQDSENVERQKPCCTKCKQPVKGHDGPTGAGCMNIAEASPREHVQPSPSGNNMDMVLSELVTQMTHMNINLTTLITGQADLATRFDQNITGNGARPRDNSTGARPRDNNDTNVRRQPDPAINDGTGTTKPDKHVAQAIDGEFVHLSDFLPNIEYMSGEMEPIVDNGTFRLRPKKARKFIDSFSVWSRAWNAYEKVLMTHHADKYNKFATYRELIQSCDTKYQWHAVSTYDIRFRSELATRKSFDYDKIDTMLFTTIFDATAIKTTARSCLRCKSYDHFVSNCPFPAETSRHPQTSGNDQKPRDRRKPQEQWFANGKEGCNNFQKGNCNYAGCTRAHVCRQCKGPDPLYKCKSCT